MRGYIAHQLVSKGKKDPPSSFARYNDGPGVPGEFMVAEIATIVGEE
jgi:hypothetical protein